MNEGAPAAPAEPAPAEPVGEGRPVGRTATIVVCVLLALLTPLILYTMWEFWPRTAGEKIDLTKPQPVSYFGWKTQVSREVLFFLIVALAGALGGLIHTLRSISWYVGNRRLRWSWVPFNLLLPIVGALGGTVFYLILRGGLFSPATSVKEANPFGFAAVAVLVGLFSEQALEKLRQVASNLFTERPTGEDHFEPPERPRA